MFVSAGRMEAGHGLKFKPAERRKLCSEEEAGVVPAGEDGGKPSPSSCLSLCLTQRPAAHLIGRDGFCSLSGRGQECNGPLVKLSGTAFIVIKQVKQDTRFFNLT